MKNMSKDVDILVIFAVLLLREVKDGGRRGAFAFSLKERLSTGGWGEEGGEGILPQGLSSFL